MELRHLRYFLALAEELHYGRAAQRLSITQPPLSLNIQQLEASVGAPLFVRNSRGVALTAAGQAFVPAARAVLDQVARASREAREVAQGVRGHLQVGFAGTVMFRGLAPILRRFAQDHPSLRLSLREMSSSDQLADLLQDRLDAGFVHTARVPPGCSQILVSRQGFVACLPAGHALARRRTLALGQLVGEPFVLIDREVSPDYHDRLIALCADHGLEPDTRVALQHWLSVVAAVSQGLGVSLVPEGMRQVGLPGVAFVRLAGEVPVYDTHCLWKTDREGPALAAFLAAVRGIGQALESKA